MKRKIYVWIVGLLLFMSACSRMPAGESSEAELIVAPYPSADIELEAQKEDFNVQNDITPDTAEKPAAIGQPDNSERPDVPEQQSDTAHNDSPLNGQPIERLPIDAQESKPEQEPAHADEPQQTPDAVGDTISEPLQTEETEPTLENGEVSHPVTSDTPIHTTGLQQDENGGIFCAEPDGSLRMLPEGILELDGELYWNTVEGYLVQPPQAGAFWTGSELYWVREDGSLLVNDTQGFLTFGADGKYTSGNTNLDAAVLQYIADHTGAAEDTETILRNCYDYFRDHYTYLSMEHQPAGTTYWAEDCAVTFFDMKKGNCYCWAAAVMYVARQLGYQAYVVAGWEYSAVNEHAWTMIDWPDGQVYLFDAQLEYAYLFQQKKGSIDMFKTTDSGNSVYNGKQYYFP